MWVAVVLTACAPAWDGPVVVLQRDEAGDYALGPRDLDDFDAVRVSGALGTAWRGGQLQTDGYSAGGRVRVRGLSTPDGWVAADEDGLVLWSFYHALSDGEVALTELGGADLDPLWPVDIAWNPVSIYDFAAAENAAFANGMHLFLLMPDRLDGVPLAANAGVVRHELAHAWFEILTTGTSGGPDPLRAEPVWVIQSARALNEGFADAVAALSLDDPRFLAPSLDLPSRVVGRAAAVARPEDYPSPDDDPLLDLLLGYDPYVLGTVYASFAWDLAALTGDRAGTLVQLADALAAWGEEAAWGDPDRWVVLTLERVPDAVRSDACAAAALRFPHLEDPPPCR